MGAGRDLRGRRTTAANFRSRSGLAPIRLGEQITGSCDGADITARKQTEVALARSEAQLRRLVEQAPVSIAMFDRDMHYIVTSRRWVSEYGRGDRT